MVALAITRIAIIVYGTLALSRPAKIPPPGDKDGRCTCAAPCHGLKEWSTSEELAAWLGIEITALYWMRSRRNGPRGHKIGSGILYRRNDVEKWLLSRAEDE